MRGGNFHFVFMVLIFLLLLSFFFWSCGNNLDLELPICLMRFVVDISAGCWGCGREVVGFFLDGGDSFGFGVGVGLILFDEMF